jgi:hypothetical protein
VLAGYRTLDSGRQGQARELRGLLTLRVSLDRFVMPALAHPAPPRQVDPEGDEDLDEAAADDVPPDAAPDPGARERARHRLIHLIRPRLARRTVARALAHAGYDAARRRLDGLSSRARSSAALPELRLRGGRSIDQSLRLSPTTSDPFRYTETGGADLFFEARLSWELDRLVFSSSELSIERLRRQRGQDARDLIEDVLDDLFAWQRARLRIADPAAGPLEREVAIIEALEAAVRLDILTGGWFSEQLEREREAGRVEQVRELTERDDD